MTAYHARRATTETFELAEGPVWDAVNDRVLWVDILAGTVLSGRLDGAGITVTGSRSFGEPVGAVLPAADGRLAVVARERILFAAEGGAVEAGPVVVPTGARSRTNDAAVDPAGRLLVGTHPFDGGDGSEVLVQLDGDRVRVLDDDLLLSNGLCWSPDGGTLYSVDTLAATVWARDYDVGSGATGPRRVHLEVDGMPDGMCADTDGNLWIAFWGRGEVRRYDATGAVIDTVAVDAPHTSSVAFAGPGLHTLVITTARADLDADALAAAPASGALFTAEVAAQGLPQPRYRR
ncbi:SMP-30/gluconolactonase/LRE family protein [Leifsonia sp. ZF2019]|uniref:SMP-30/gluconolactonase/LRE family protein n=1 Tax=Leifsonia sp. ZF2019 TaxID=2781978 RepID=UPI001CBB6764|nr:SMP-30/gluconolactonase/LRE family protein [Leifsonia sp. ZF2019]UAJ81068.1 SMP-30/gluconolactonase/LRE family protein [Leifsonia sp. ZF2019]